MNDRRIDEVLDQAGWAGRRRERAAAVLRRETREVPMTAPGEGVVVPVLVTVFGYLSAYVAFVQSWRLLGGDIYAIGQVRAGFFIPLLVAVLGAVLGHRGATRLAISVGLRLRRRLLDAVLTADPDQLKYAGLGGLFALALEADLVAAGVSAAAPVILPAAVELVVAIGVLSAGPGAVWTILATVIGSAALVVTAARVVRLRRLSSISRTELSQRLVERLLGHRTVLVQEDSATEALWSKPAQRRYAVAVRSLDVTESLLAAYPLLTLAGVVLVAVNAASEAAPTAISIGGGLLAASALTRMASLVQESAGAWVAWRSLQPLLHTPTVAAEVEGGSEPDDPTVQVSLREAEYRYPDKSGGVVDIDLDVHRDERLLLTGASGSGKTTIASLLAGTRRVSRGTRTLAPDTRVVFVPQAGDNHIFRGSLLYNVLLDRWPPSDPDMAAVATVLESVGLSTLISRMPGGLSQPIGEAGWRLSDGETSRIHLARALMERPDVLILDESFGALDPRTVREVCAVAASSAPTLIVIAHP